MGVFEVVALEEEEEEGDVKRLSERAVERKYPDRRPSSAEENAMAYIEGEDGEEGGESEVDIFCGGVEEGARTIAGSTRGEERKEITRRLCYMNVGNIGAECLS